jgi:integrase/recombinase XerD
MEDVLLAFLAEMHRRNFAAATITGYRDAIEEFFCRLRQLNITDPRQVRRSHVEEHQAWLLGRKLKPRTVAHRIQAIRGLFEHLTSTGKLLTAPTDGVVALKLSRVLPRRVVTEREMQKLLAAPDVVTALGIRDRAMLEMLYSTAMRAGEILSLEVADIDTEHGLVHIREGKGRKDRVVPLGRAAQTWVRRYTTDVRPGWLKNESERGLFVSKHGTPFTVENLHAMLRRHCTAAKLEHIYPHAIRHAVATHMLARGADLRAVQKLLGHASLTTTQFYTRVTPTEVLAAHRRTHPLEAGP